jgi:hypothetical protein
MKVNNEKMNKMILAGPSECNGIDSSGKCLHPASTASMTSSTSAWNDSNGGTKSRIPYPPPEQGNGNGSKATTKAEKFLIWLKSFRKGKIFY